MEPVLEIEGLWQSFRPKNRHGGRRRRRTVDPKWALRDLNLTVDGGETLGIVGTNGSGKSTLLRTIAGVYRPDLGQVWVRGRVSSLLDLETGLNRDLTARENLLIGGVLLGLSRAEMRERYDRIVEFSGLDERALHQPLSSFSSGMELRLTFSVVLNSDPSVLLVDEVFAVGDKDFRRQCADRVEELRRNGCGVLLVSHDLELIESRCTRVVVLDRGSMVFDGSVPAALAQYRGEPDGSPASVPAENADLPGVTERQRPLRVAFIIRSLDDGGAQRQLTNLAIGLHERGDHVLVVSHFRGGSFAEQLQSRGVHVDSCDKDSRVDLRYLWRLRRLLRAHEPDIVACYMSDSNIMGLMYRATSPRTLVVMGFRNDAPNRWASTRVSRALPRVEKKLARFADATVANSKRGQRYLLDHRYPNDRVHQISNGIDIDRFRPDDEKRAVTRARWGIAEDEVLIGFVGRRHPQKAIPHYLEAARRVSDHDKSARFVLIGKELYDDYTAQLYEQAESLRLVPPLFTWHPSYPDMPAAYNAFDLLVNSSFNEGIANCIVEALACGTPCVVTDVGDSALIVGDPRRVVEPGNVDQLTDAILEALGRSTVREKVRAGVLEFDIDTMVDQTRDLYVEILRKRGGRRSAS